VPGWWGRGARRRDPLGRVDGSVGGRRHGGEEIRGWCLNFVAIYFPGKWKDRSRTISCVRPSQLLAGINYGLALGRDNCIDGKQCALQ
jgi:hypothetical protein